MKGLNSIHFRDSLTFIFEFIPQLIFMLSLVGFMDLLIFYKWSTDLIPDFSYDEKKKMGLDNKPLIINTIIEMCMFKTPAHIMFTGQGLLMKVNSYQIDTTN